MEVLVEAQRPSQKSLRPHFMHFDG